MGLVLFIDMDSFYASCELLRHPELRDKPFIVGTSDEANKHRGVVETANFLAKKTGVRSAMPVSMAMKINKNLVYVPSDHAYYDSMSLKVMDMLRSFKYKMEVLSVDEAALDLDAMSYEDAEALAKKIKQQINTVLGLPCTAGVADGKIIAKIVCDSAKPDGLKVVRQKDLLGFLSDLNVQKIPGVGSKTAERLAAMGITKIRDLANSNPEMLSSKIGVFGRELYLIANGKDESKIIEVWETKSIGRERTLDKRSSDPKELDKMLDTLAEEVMDEVKKGEFSFKTVTVKARYVDFTERLKSKSLPAYSDSLEVLQENAHALIREVLGEMPLRKIGVRVSSLAHVKKQKKLF